ncbi:hypothetical protein BKA57DRAFT_512898 [Linnemannia elongata]|nr:hypothetical protein BKA57DRAFT_512898 [Linnemannia elongata]
MPAHQRFRLGDIIESLAVRTDANGQLYSHLPDIQNLFPEATTTSRFKVDEVNLFFLEDDYGKRYEPKRIAHYPDDIIDIVPAASMYVPLSQSVSRTEYSDRTVHSQSQPTPSPLANDIEYAVSTLSLQPIPTSTLFSPKDLVCLLDSANAMTASNPLLAGLVAYLSSNDSGILDIKQQVAQLNNTGSAQHHQLMEQIANLLEKQNDLLQQQVDAKVRDEKMLAELEAAKERDLETHRLQKQTIERLIVAQQRVDAILVQNYELHEYSIPRLFVILPDSYESWDPRNFLKERFRLFFLCECGENCEQGTHQGTIAGGPVITTANPPIAPIRIKNRIHLAKHEGYELSRPAEFFDRYGPYVLGMLKILKHCLAVAAVVAPAVALADNGIKEVTDGVKSIAESTMQAVDISIKFLEQQLDDGGVSDDVSGTGSDGQDANDMFENLAALEGADLRRLDTFLRNNDKDKILGNLYRITTEQGHVKWVCFHHYKETYRDTALASFIQSIEVANGTYDPHFRRVTIDLTSSTVAKDFFKRLTRQAPAVDILDVTLSWKFGSADLVNLVDMVAKSNLRSIAIDLQDDHTSNSNSAFAAFRPGKGRYHSLLGFFTNKNIRRLQLSNVHQLGTRTSNLPSSVVAPWIQSFQFHGEVNDDGRDRLTNILSHCPSLVDLRLTGSISQANEMDLTLHRQIFALKKLQRLHIMGWYQNYPETPEGFIWKDGMSLRELVCTSGALEHGFVEESIRRSYEVLEVLVLINKPGNYSNPELMHLASSENSDSSYFSRLTHLDLRIPLANGSQKFLSSILPQLDLIHFGCSDYADSHFRLANLASLKSLSLNDRNSNYSLLKEAMQRLGSVCQIESLQIDGVNDFDENLSEILKMLRLKRLFLSHLSSHAVDYIVQSLNLSNLQIMSVVMSGYSPEAVNVLAQRREDECTGSFMVELDVWSWATYTEAIGEGAVRTLRYGLSAPLPFGHSVEDCRHWSDHHFQFLLPILPQYTY